MTPAGTLADFQDAFATALLTSHPSAHPDVTGLAAQPGFAVYRNTVMKGALDALQANYPSVLRLVGEEWFRAAAAEFVRMSPPEHPALVRYGAQFATFLRNFPPAAELPYLHEVARLDRCWTEAHIAPGLVPMAPETIAALAPDALGALHLLPHPAARWAWFPEQPAYTIWRRNRELSDDTSEFPWQGEGAVLTRPHDSVQWRALDAAGCAFLDACARGAPLGEACASALAVNAATDIAALMALLIDAGALADPASTPSRSNNKESP